MGELTRIGERIREIEKRIKSTKDTLELEAFRALLEKEKIRLSGYENSGISEVHKKCRCKI